MAATTAAVALVVMVVGGFVGYHVRQAQQANADLQVHKGRIPRFRATRNRSGLTAILIVVAMLLILRALFFK